MRGKRWACETVRKKLHAVTETEMKQRLAEVAEVLFTRKCQFKPVLSTNPNLLVRRPQRKRSA